MERDGDWQGEMEWDRREGWRETGRDGIGERQWKGMERQGR